MRAAGLDNVVVLGLKALERADQKLDGGQQLVLNGKHRGNMHGRREGVVGRLAHVDVVVRMAEPRARELIGAVCDDLVGVHVRLRAGAGLPDDERKMAVQLAGDNLVARGADGLELLLRHFFGLEGGVCKRRRLLQNAEGMGDLTRHGLNIHADPEVFAASLRLRRPEAVGRNAHLAHGIVLDPVFHIS